MTILPRLKRELTIAAQRLDDAPTGWGRWFRSGRRSLVVVPIAVIALGGIGLAATGTLSDEEEPFSQSQYRYGQCPHHVVELGPDALDQARRAAVAQAGLAYRGRDLRGTYATAAQVVTKGSQFSADAQRCGLLGRTVLVRLRLPAPSGSASLSQGAVYVSRIQPPGRPAAYQLWALED